MLREGGRLRVGCQWVFVFFLYLSSVVVIVGDLASNDSRGSWCLVDCCSTLNASAASGVLQSTGICIWWWCLVWRCKHAHVDVGAFLRLTSYSHERLLKFENSRVYLAYW